MTLPPPPPPSPFKSRPGWHRLRAAWGYSWQGLRAAFRYEAAFRQELLLALLLLPAAWALARSSLEFVVLLLPMALVLVVELLNSAIEALADALSVERNELLGRAKDLGSAAVWLSLAILVVVWLTVGWLRWQAVPPLN